MKFILLFDAVTYLILAVLFSTGGLYLYNGNLPDCETKKQRGNALVLGGIFALEFSVIAAVHFALAR